jgi:hypothetical protein
VAENQQKRREEEQKAQANQDAIRNISNTAIAILRTPAQMAAGAMAVASQVASTVVTFVAPAAKVAKAISTASAQTSNAILRHLTSIGNAAVKANGAAQGVVNASMSALAVVSPATVFTIISTLGYANKDAVIAEVEKTAVGTFNHTEKAIRLGVDTMKQSGNLLDSVIAALKAMTLEPETIQKLDFNLLSVVLTGSDSSATDLFKAAIYQPPHNNDGHAKPDIIPPVSSKSFSFADQLHKIDENSGPTLGMPDSVALFKIINDPSGKWDIVNGHLQLKDGASVNFEDQSSFAITVTATRAGYTAETFDVTVNIADVNETPASISISGDAVTSQDHVSITTRSPDTAATLSGTDPDAKDGYGTRLSWQGHSDHFDVVDNKIVYKDAGKPLPVNGSFDETITITATDTGWDGLGTLSISRTITVHVEWVNESPDSLTLTDTTEHIIVNSVQITEKDHAIASLSATDPNANDAFTYTIVGGSGRFVIETDNGSPRLAYANTNVDLTVNPDDPVVELVTIRATDINGLHIDRTVTVIVMPVNDTPTATTTSTPVDENLAAGQVVAKMTGADQDPGDILTYSIFDPSGLFAIDSVTGTITTTGPINFEADTNGYDIVATATDTAGNVVEKAIHIDVVDKNDAPTLSVKTPSVTLVEGMPPGTPVGVYVAEDPDAADQYGAALQFSLPDFLRAEDGVIYTTRTITPADAGTFSMTATDTGWNGPPLSAVASIQTEVIGASAGASINGILVRGISINENESQGTTVGTLKAITFGATGAVTWSISDPTGQFTIDGDKIVTAQPFDFEDGGTASVQVTITGITESGATRSGVFTLTRVNVNEAPDITANSSQSVVENAPISIAMSRTDPDADKSGTWSISGASSGFSITAATGILSHAALDFEGQGSATVDVTYTDAGGLSVTKTIVVNATNANEAPAITTAAYTVAENSPISVRLASADPDADKSGTWSIVGASNGFTVNAATGDLSHAALDFEGARSGSVSIKFTDSGGLSDTKTITVTSTNVNEKPTVTSSGSFSISENASFSAVMTASDPDAGDTKAWSIVGASNGFVINPTTGTLSHAAWDYENQGATSVTVRVTDAQGLASDKIVNVSISNVNEFMTIGLYPGQSQSFSGTVSAGTSGFGPSTTSSAFNATAGDSIKFVWQANPDTDHWIAHISLINASTGYEVAKLVWAGGNLQPVVGWSGDTGTGTGAVSTYANIPYAGTFYVLSTVGSYDESQGSAIGASLYLHELTLTHYTG